MIKYVDYSDGSGGARNMAEKIEEITTIDFIKECLCFYKKQLRIEKNERLRNKQWDLSVAKSKFKDLPAQQTVPERIVAEKIEQEILNISNTIEIMKERVCFYEKKLKQAELEEEKRRLEIKNVKLGAAKSKLKDLSAQQTDSESGVDNSKSVKDRKPEAVADKELSTPKEKKTLKIIFVNDLSFHVQQHSSIEKFCQNKVVDVSVAFDEVQSFNCYAELKPATHEPKGQQLLRCAMHASTNNNSNSPKQNKTSSVVFVHNLSFHVQQHSSIEKFHHYEVVDVRLAFDEVQNFNCHAVLKHEPNGQQRLRCAMHASTNNNSNYSAPSGGNLNVEMVDACKSRTKASNTPKQNKTSKILFVHDLSFHVQQHSSIENFLQNEDVVDVYLAFDEVGSFNCYAELKPATHEPNGQQLLRCAIQASTNNNSNSPKQNKTSSVVFVHDLSFHVQQHSSIGKFHHYEVVDVRLAFDEVQNFNCHAVVLKHEPNGQQRMHASY